MTNANTAESASETYFCETCNTEHNALPWAVEIFWNPDYKMWVSMVVSDDDHTEAHNYGAHYHYNLQRLLDMTKESMEANLNNYYGNASIIKVYSKKNKLWKRYIRWAYMNTFGYWAERH